MAKIPAYAVTFVDRLRATSPDSLDAFVETEIHSGRPSIFNADTDTRRFQAHIATGLGISDSSSDVMIVGSAKMGFSLNPARAFEPFADASDIDVVVVHAALFDFVWQTMLAWDYLTIRARGAQERDWLSARRVETWSGWSSPPAWNLRESGGIDLSFPGTLKPLRALSHRWFSTFRSLALYKHHPEIPRHRVNARLYRTRLHAAMYHAMGLRAIRNTLVTAAAPAE